jgi:hypothetical protein
VQDSERIVEDIAKHIQEEVGRNKDLSYTTPLQLADERI